MDETLTPLPRFPVWPIAAGTAALAVVMWGREIGIGTDAVHYLATARHLYEGAGWLDYNGAPLAVWPPLYPLLVAAGMWIGLDLLTAAKVVNLMAYAAAAFWAWKIIERTVPSPFQKGAFLLYAFGQPLMIMGTQAMSEPFFIAWVNGTLYFMIRYFDDGAPRSGIYLSLLLTAAVLQRYIGITLWIAGTVGLIWHRRNAGLHREFLRWGAISALPLGLLGGWLIRSYWVSGTVGGVRGNPFYSMVEWAQAAVRTLIDWTVPWVEQFGPLWNAGAAAAFAVLAGVTVWICRKQHGDAPSPAWRRMLGWTVLYLLFLAWSSHRMWISLPGQRLLSPLFIVFVVGLGRAAGCTRRVRPTWRRAVHAVFTGVIGLHVGQSAYALYSAYRHGVHYDALSHRPLERWLRNYDGKHPVVTNHPERFFLEAIRRGRKVDWMIPDRLINQPPDTLFFLWDPPPGWVRPPSARLYFLTHDSLLRAHFKLDTVIESGGEAVVRLVRKPTAPKPLFSPR